MLLFFAIHVLSVTGNVNSSMRPHIRQKQQQHPHQLQHKLQCLQQIRQRQQQHMQMQVPMGIQLAQLTQMLCFLLMKSAEQAAACMPCGWPSNELQQQQPASNIVAPFAAAAAAPRC